MHVFLQNMVLQGLCELLLVQAAIGQICAFVANLIFVANTRFFWFVLSRLLLRHWGFYSDFVQISAQKTGGYATVCLWGGGEESCYFMETNT